MLFITRKRGGILNTYEVYVNDDLSFIIERVEVLKVEENTILMISSRGSVVAAFDITNVVMVRLLN